MNWALSSFKSI